MSAALTETRPRSSILPSLVALSLGVVVLVGIFWPECRAAVKVWYESTAYGHCFLVLPIAAFLAWDRRDSVRGLFPRPIAAAALLGLPLPILWLAAERLGVMEGRQLVAVATIELLFLVVLGWRLFTALSGPLLYLFFLVPFGAFLTPVLQSYTAWFIDVGLNVLGIPHFITDMTIEISAGSFYVAEACAGLRFLIASVAFGVFFALLNYRSPGRRAAFMAASIIVPVIANGFRALGIVVLGNILGSAQAAAADHLVYGWFFFSFVTLLLVLAGLPFRETPTPPPSNPERSTESRTQPRAAAFVLILAAVGPAAAFALDRNVTPAVFSGRPEWIAAAGCHITPGEQAGGRFTDAMICGDRAWSIVTEAVPARSTGAALAEARRALIGTIDSDEAVIAALPGAPGWQSIVSPDPAMVIGIAAWVDGRPVTGGLNQRLVQARNSVFGAALNPVVMALSLRPGTRMTQAQTTAALADLSRFVAAQPGLAAELARISPAVMATSSPLPRS